MLKIGILSLQGAIEEHEILLEKAADSLGIAISVSRVILPEDIVDIDGIVIPGGESSAMKLIGSRNGMLQALQQKLTNDLPAFGTCAGAILLSREVRRTVNSDHNEGAFPILNVEILRNGYGRQADSFSTSLVVETFAKNFKGIFIRAPVFQSSGKNVEILASIQGKPVYIKQGNIMATTFHPELTDDPRIHESFLRIVLENN